MAIRRRKNVYKKEPIVFDEISEIIESFELEIEDGGPDASNICVPIDDVKKLIRSYSSAHREAEELKFYRKEALVEMREQLEMLSEYCGEGVTEKIRSVVSHIQRNEVDYEEAIFRAKSVEAEIAKRDAWARRIDRCETCKIWYSQGMRCLDCINYKTNRYVGAKFSDLWTPAWD